MSLYDGFTPRSGIPEIGMNEREIKRDTPIATIFGEKIVRYRRPIGNSESEPEYGYPSGLHTRAAHSLMNLPHLQEMCGGKPTLGDLQRWIKIFGVHGLLDSTNIGKTTFAFISETLGAELRPSDDEPNACCPYCGRRR